MAQEQEEDTQEVFIPTEIMGDYKYSDHSRIRRPCRLWTEHGYKLKFLIPALLFALYIALMFYLDFFGMKGAS